MQPRRGDGGRRARWPRCWRWLGGTAPQLQEPRWAAADLRRAARRPARSSCSPASPGAAGRVRGALLAGRGRCSRLRAHRPARGAPRSAEALAPALEGRDARRHRRRRQPAAGRRRTASVSASRSRSASSQARRACRARIALGWYGGFHEDAALLGAAARALRAGQRWRFTVRLRRPHGNLNPHGFDYELALFEQGVRATGYVRDAAGAGTLLERQAGFPVERAAPGACATRSTRAWPTRAPPACWPRSPSATRARSSATTGSCSATPASPT